VVAGDGKSGSDDFGSGVEELEDALGGGHGGLQDVVFVAEILDGAEETLRVLDEGDEDAKGDGIAEDAVGAAAGGKTVEVVRICRCRGRRGHRAR